MNPPKLTFDKNELVIKKEAWINLIIGIPAISLFALVLFFHAESKQFFKENLLATIVALLIIFIAIYFLIRNTLDKRIKMVINEEGIWTSKKGLIVWNSFRYYYFEETKTEHPTASLLKIKLHEPEKEITIDISFLNTSEKEIDEAIKHNSGDYKIISLKESY